MATDSLLRLGPLDLVAVGTWDGTSFRGAGCSASGVTGNYNILLQQPLAIAGGQALIWCGVNGGFNPGISVEVNEVDPLNKSLLVRRVDTGVTIAGMAWWVFWRLAPPGT